MANGKKRVERIPKEWVEEFRGLRYRQHKPDGTVIAAEWLTDFPAVSLGAALSLPAPRVCLPARNLPAEPADPCSLGIPRLLPAPGRSDQCQKR
jgi:hypothetical protein